MQKDEASYVEASKIGENGQKNVFLRKPVYIPIYKILSNQYNKRCVERKRKGKGEKKRKRVGKMGI